MLIVDEIVSGGESTAAPVAPAGLLDHLLEYLKRPEIGGITGLIKKFSAAGLGAQVQSWIGAGRKLPVTPADVTRALGSTEVAGLAARAGISTEQASQQLADILPNVVMQLTPGGKPLGGALTGIGQAFGA